MRKQTAFLVGFILAALLSVPAYGRDQFYRPLPPKVAKNQAKAQQKMMKKSAKAQRKELKKQQKRGLK